MEENSNESFSESFDENIENSFNDDDNDEDEANEYNVKDNEFDLSFDSNQEDSFNSENTEEGEDKGINTSQEEDESFQHNYNNKTGETTIIELDDSNAKCRITPINGDIRNRELKKDKEREKRKRRNQTLITEDSIPKNYIFKKYKVERSQVESIKKLVVERYFDFENNTLGYNSGARDKWGNSRTERAISIIGNTNRLGQEIKDDYRNLLAMAPVINKEGNVFYMRSQTNKEKKYPYKIVISKDGSKYSCTCPDFTIHKKANELHIQNKSLGYVRVGHVDKLVRPMDYILICKHIRCAYVMLTVNGNKMKRYNDKPRSALKTKKTTTTTTSNISNNDLNNHQHRNNDIDSQLSSIFGCYVNKEARLTTINDKNKWKTFPFELNTNLSLEIYNGYYLKTNYINEISSRLNIPNDKVLLLLNNCFGYNRIERAQIIVDKLSFFITPFSDILKKELQVNKLYYKKIQNYITQSSSYMVYFIPEVETRSYQYWMTNESKSNSLRVTGQVVVYSSDILSCTCYEHTVNKIEFCTHIIAFYYFYSKGNQLGTATGSGGANIRNSKFQGMPIDVWRFIHLMDSSQRSNNIVPVLNPIINEMMYQRLTFKENQQYLNQINIEEIKKLTVSNSMSYYNNNWRSTNYGITLKFSKNSLKLSHIKPLNNSN